MTQETVDLSFLAKLNQKNNEELKVLRKEIAEIRTLSLQTYEYMKRVERRQSELRDDLDIAIKMEIGGGLTHLQAVLENTLSRIEGKVDEAMDRVTAIERRP